MAKSRVLISGAGPAGTVLAYWLGKHGFDIVILERSSSRRSLGQIIDIEGPSQEIVTRMGIMEEIKAKTTHEAGIRFVGAHNEEVATFPTGSIGVSNEIEIMRGDLADAFFDAAKSQANIDIRLGCTIQSLRQTESKVVVSIQDRINNLTTDEEYDLLVACDGMRSTTRDLILPAPEYKDCLKPIGAFAAFFSIPATPEDGPLARVYSMTNRRTATIKPLNKTTSSAYLTYLNSDPKFDEARNSGNIQTQKHLIAKLFENERWEVPRLIEEMMQTDNFYFESLAQTRLNRWSYGRCVLLGDTAYAPSPLTGQGTNLAILGAYLLASKLVQNPEEPTKAFEAWETKMRPYVDQVQPIPLGGYLPYLINPATAVGVWVLRKIVALAAWSQVWMYFPEIKNVPFDLPDL
ncbi:hypothetical protein H2198_008474 [Neophaeococcomyces mojaviensis]|uniref:Uncharacterized protein n=1 Tax=Neophaeococcomyces mojaviensis TaxID=3383035 RepID=A0ACC2ZX71_9EURO|nr:hypothetical protein H2198_008474 [Knufia sp. JES_112]